MKILDSYMDVINNTMEDGEKYIDECESGRRYHLTKEDIDALKDGKCLVSIVGKSVIFIDLEE